MKSTKSLSLASIIVFSISLWIIVSFIDVDNEAALGWGLISTIYGIVVSSISYSKMNRQIKLNTLHENTEIGIIEKDLIKLNKLKNNGLITEEEFVKRRDKILD